MTSPRPPGSGGAPAASAVGVRRRVLAVPLKAFRRLPAPLRRLVVRAGTPSFMVGAVCALVCDEHVLVLRQAHRTGWSLPGGLIQRGESAAECVQREVLEETGVTVAVGLPVVTVVAADEHRVDVVFRIDVPSRFAVQADSEAERAAWRRLDGLVDVDSATRDILDGLRRASDPGAYGGRVVERS